MYEWLDFSIRLEGSGLFLLAVPAICGLVYYIYHRTYPVVDKGTRIALTSARILVMGLLLLILVEPIFGLWNKAVVHPLLLVLVDTSPSMAVDRRLEQIEEVISEAHFRSVLAGADIQSRGFADETYLLSLDTLAAVRVEGKATDLAGALNESLARLAGRDRLEGVLILSDGGHNLGADPVRLAEELNVPIFTLGIPGTGNPADIQIVRVETGETGYVNQHLAIEAKLRHWGYANAAVDALLYEGEKEVGRQRLVLQDDMLEQAVVFEVMPTRPGPHIYRISVPPREGEATHDNNEVLVFTQIAKERIQVLLVADGPSPDLAFIRRSLEADAHLSVEVAVQRRDGGSYYEGVRLDTEYLRDKDVVILLNPGKNLMAGGEAQAIVDRVRAGAGLFFVGGPKTFARWNSAASIADVLPLLVKGSGSVFAGREISLRIGREGRRHPVVRLQNESADPWAELPPLTDYVAGVRKRKGAAVLVEGESGEATPLIAAGTHGQGKVIAALATGFWRLDLLSSGADGRPQTIREFWQNGVKWLAIRASTGRVRVSTERQIYRAGERVVFAAQVFDELLRPQNAARVQVVLGEREVQLQEQGEGHYRGVWSGLDPGDYTYQARAFVGDRVIGADEGRFIVEQYRVESVDVRPNNALLAELARASGGQYRQLAQWRQLVDAMPLQKRLVEETHILPLWGQRWPLVLVVLLLALEWFARKRRGLI